MSFICFDALDNTDWGTGMCGANAKRNTNDGWKSLSENISSVYMYLLIFYLLRAVSIFYLNPKCSWMINKLVRLTISQTVKCVIY